MRRLLILTMLTAALLAGCSSGNNNTPSGSPTFTTHYGQDAALIATHIHGCRHVKARGGGYLLPGAESAATCQLSGHLVILFAWRNSSAEQRPLTTFFGKLTSYARGTGWTVLPGDRTAADAQLAEARTVTASIGGRIVHQS